MIIWIDSLGPPPQVIWITCGNTSNARLKEILTNTLPKALELLESGENLIEINAIEKLGGPGNGIRACTVRFR